MGLGKDVSAPSCLKISSLESYWTVTDCSAVCCPYNVSLEGSAKSMVAFMHPHGTSDSEQPHQANPNMLKFTSPPKRARACGTQLSDPKLSNSELSSPRSTRASWLLGTRLLPKWALHVELMVKWPCKELSRLRKFRVCTSGTGHNDHGQQCLR